MAETIQEPVEDVAGSPEAASLGLSLAEIQEKYKQVEASMRNAYQQRQEQAGFGNEASVLEIDRDLTVLAQTARDLQARYDETQGQQAQAAQKYLESGDFQVYKEVQPGATTGPFAPMIPSATRMPQSKETNRNLATSLAQISGVDVNDIDLDNGIPASTNFAVGVLTQPESKLQLLAKTYGPENVKAVQVGDKTEFLVRKNDGKFSITNQRGVSGAVSAFSQEAIPTTSAILTTLGVSATGVGLIGTPFVAAGTYAGVGVAQDTALQSIFGVDVTPMKVITNRGTTAAIGIPIDMATMGTSRLLSRRLGSNIASKLGNEIDAAAARLSQRTGEQISVPPAAHLFGEKGMVTLGMLAEDQPRSGMARSMARAQQTLTDLMATMRGTTLPQQQGTRAYMQTADELRRTRRALSEQVARLSQAPTDTVENLLNRRINALKATQADKDSLGEMMFPALREAEDQANVIKNETFDAFYDLAERNGVNASREELLSVIQGAVSQRRPFRNPAIEGIIKELQEEINAQNGPASVRELNDWIKRIDDIAPSESVGQKTAKQVASKVSQDVDALKQRVIKDGGLEDAWNQARSDYNRRMQFERNTLGSVLRDKFGDSVKTPRQISDAILQEPATIREITGALAMLEAKDPAQKGLVDSMRERMQKVYLDSAGLGANPGTQVRINYDRNIVRELWGSSADRMMKSFDDINRLKLKANPTFADVMKLQGALDQRTRQTVIRQIQRKSDAESKLEELTNNKIFQLAKEGRFQNIDGAILADAILSPTTSLQQTRDILMAMNASDRQFFAGDFTRELLNRYPGGQASSRAPHSSPFDTEKFLRDWEAPMGQSRLSAKAKLVIGKDNAEFFHDFAKVYDAVRFRPKPDKEQVRTIMGLGGVSVYLANGLTHPIRNYFMAAALSSGSYQKSGLIRFLAKDVGAQKTEEAYQRMFSNLLTTRTGLMALASQAKDDPEFAEYLNKFYSEFKTDEELARETIDKQPNSVEEKAAPK